MGKLLRVISENGGAVVYAVDATDIVAEMERIHKTSATASAALGRLLTAGAMMGSVLKAEQDTLTLSIRADGPIGTITVVANSKGEIKGYCNNPLADLPLNQTTGKLDVAGVVGRNGTLYVVKDFGLKEPYVGRTPIVSGEIAEDITQYYAVSEQTPTACALGVLVNPDLTIKVAGGYILQLMPGAPEAELAALEANTARLDSITAMLDAGTEMEDIAYKILEGFEPQILEEATTVYRCGCGRDKMEKALVSLGKQDLSELSEDETTEIVCNFCRERYYFSKQEILELIDRQNG